MKNFWLALLFVPGLALAQKEVPVQVTNPATADFPDAPVVITRAQLEKWGLKIKNKQTPLVAEGSNNLASQTDDLNGDGQWDELAFIVTMKAKEKKEISVRMVDDKEAPKYKVRAHARLGMSANRDNKFETVKTDSRPADWKPQAMPMRYQLEGPGWENDKVAFRHYFDARNGKDVFGKTTDRMVIDEIGVPNTANADYHTLKDWGMDILKAGNSLGAGSWALKKGDEVIPMGQTDSSKYQVLSDGPVRAMIRLTHTGWKVGGKDRRVTEDISIWAGAYYYQNKVTITGTAPGEEFIVGVTNMKNPNPTAAENPAVGNFARLATHAKQSENNDMLGMAVLVPKAQFLGFDKFAKEATPINSSFYARLRLINNQPITYYFLAGWEKSNYKFATSGGFTEFVDQQAILLSGLPKVSSTATK